MSDAKRPTITIEGFDVDPYAATLTVDEIIERHRGEWVLMRVTEHDDGAWPSRGYLLDWAPTQEEILKAWKRRVPDLADGNRWPLYSFLAEPLITSGPEYNAAVLEFFSGLLQAGALRDADAGRDRAWLAVSLSIGDDAKIELVPNSVATRSVITPVAYQKLREANLIDLDVFDFHTGRVTSVIRNVAIGDRPAPDLTVQIRDVPELQAGDGAYLVDGYLGLDYLFFGDFGSIEINTRTLHVTLRVDSRSPLA